MPDFFGIYHNLKVYEYMEFFANAHGLYGLKARNRWKELLEMADLLDYSDSFVEDLSRGYAATSLPGSSYDSLTSLSFT